ncbi:hypothetical protein ACH4TX_14895 [Streptomyces sp. NPDC021098]|uniref:hypothetical protein n=1 Tax=unclassified Streptomyces TaxID=2593676 RepID=UPI0037A43215
MSGPLRLVPPAPAPSVPTPSVPTPSVPTPPLPSPRRGDGGGGPRRPRWAHDPVDELIEEQGELIAAAVHPDEIAAVLEADGLTGDQAQERFGRRDTFALAAELYARVPSRHPAPPPRTDPWAARPGRFLFRGLVFALPGLGYALGAPFLSGPSDVLGLPAGSGALTASALVGWAWNQALAHRAYTQLASGGRAAAGRCLRLGAPLGAVLACLAALLLPAPGAALAFAAGQSVYLAAATALLVLGKERLLPLALLPTAVGAGLSVAVQLPSWVRMVALLATIGAVLAAAAGVTVRAWREAEDTVSVPAPPLAASLPYGLFGLGCAVLTTMAALGDMVRYGAGAALAGATVIALTLSMGAAEWLLHRCRGLALGALAHSTAPAGLRLRAAGVLGLCLTGYLTALTALVFATHALWPAASPATAPPQLGAARLLAVLALGAVLWSGLLLQAFGSAWPPAAVCLAAAGAETAALALKFSVPAVVQLAVCGGASAVLLVFATTLLGRITTHR